MRHSASGTGATVTDLGGGKTGLDVKIHGDVELFSVDNSSVAVGVPVNHDFTAPSTVRIRSVVFSSTDVAKIEVQVAADGVTFIQRDIQYITTDELDGKIVFNDYIKLQAGGKLRVIKTNRRITGGQNINSTIVYNLGD